MSFAAGQSWTYRAPEGFQSSRIIIGAIFAFADADNIICCSVIGAPGKHPDGQLAAVTIPFLPMTGQALAATVVAQDGMQEPPAVFAEKLEEWSTDARGLMTFNVPFDGYLDHLIAHQMAKIVGLNAA